EAQTKLQRSGLARAVGSEHTDDLARPHLEGEIVHREDRAVTLAQPVRFHGGCHFWRTPFRVEPSSCGPEAMCTPASRSARNLSCAVPLPPEMIAPAWPMRFPGGAVAPAMKPTTGFLVFALIQAAASSSSPPPISPMRITASVSGSLAKSWRASTNVMP